MFNIGWDSLETVQMNSTEDIAISKYLDRVRRSATPISDCRHTEIGETYRGMLAHTVWGHQCEAWVNIHQTGFKDEHFPEKSMLKARNFCRNPNRDHSNII